MSFKKNILGYLFKVSTGRAEFGSSFFHLFVFLLPLLYCFFFIVRIPYQIFNKTTLTDQTLPPTSIATVEFSPNIAKNAGVFVFNLPSRVSRRCGLPHHTESATSICKDVRPSRTTQVSSAHVDYSFETGIGAIREVKALYRWSYCISADFQWTEIQLHYELTVFRG